MSRGAVREPPAAPLSRVVLVSFGLESAGKRELVRIWGKAIKALWHRVDLVFDRTTHLSRCGTKPLAQDEFRRIYPHHVDYLEEVAAGCLAGARESDYAHFFACRHGHHRSVAFVELLRGRLCEKHHGLVVVVWHLDLEGEAGRHSNLRALKRLHENEYEDHVQ